MEERGGIMILVVDVTKEKLHSLEFVKPIEDILKEDYFVKKFDKVTNGDLKKADKVIICGTSLKDNYFLEKLDKFGWLKNFEKPVLGICAGFQIIGLVFGAKKKEKLEIGYFDENFGKDFLGFKGKFQVYHLHNNYLELGKDFEIFNKGGFAQAVKHKEKPIYGTLFHPEVRNKEMILNFVNL